MHWQQWAFGGLIVVYLLLATHKILPGERTALIVGQSAILYLGLLAGIRFLGKRELVELTPSELILTQLITNLVVEGILEETYTVFTAFAGAFSMLGLAFIISVLRYRFHPFQKVMEGEPVVLFHEGRFIQHAMDLERVDGNEILSEMRTHGFESLDQIRTVILESDGDITFLPKERKAA